MALIPTLSGGYALARRRRAPYPRLILGLGENIERLRTAKGKHNAAAFAREMGITAATLNDWESGRYKNLRLDSLLLLAKHLGCGLDSLLEGVDSDYDKIVVAQRDPIRHEGDQASDLSRGKNADVPASSRLQKEHDHLLRATTEVASHMLQALAALSEQGIQIPVLEHNARTRTRKRNVRARARKAG